MVIKPSNPLSVVVFLFSVARDGFFWFFDWVGTRYQMMLFRVKEVKAGQKSWLSYFF